MAQRKKNIWSGLQDHCPYSIIILHSVCIYRRAERKSRLKRKKDKLEARVLSFGDEDEHEEEEIITQVKKKKVGKNPNVDTSFLPDRDREVCDI